MTFGLILVAFCSYEPEIFPGLIYRMVQPKIVLLIFVSGKGVLTGAKVIALVLPMSALAHFKPMPIYVLLQERCETNEAFENIYPVLTEFRK